MNRVLNRENERLSAQAPYMEKALIRVSSLYARMSKGEVSEFGIVRNELREIISDFENTLYDMGLVG